MKAVESGVVHGIADCEDCTWKSSSYKNILAIGSLYAQRNKHRVTVEVGYYYVYDGRLLKEKARNEVVRK